MPASKTSFARKIKELVTLDKALQHCDLTTAAQFENKISVIINAKSFFLLFFYVDLR